MSISFLFRLRWNLVFVSVLIFLFSSFQKAESRILNLSGSAEMIYSSSWTEQNSEETQIETIQQRYHLGNTGDIWDPRLGTFHVRGTLLDLKSYGDGTNSDLEVLDFNSSANLFPRLFPLNLYYQRVDSDDKNVFSKDTRTTYGLNWVFPLRNLPTFRLNLQQSELDSHLSFDSTTRFANLTGDGKFRGMNIRASSQYTEVENEGGFSHDSYSLNLNLDGPVNISETMTLNGFVTYANRGGGPVGGLGTFQERGLGLSLFHRPSLNFNWNTSYSFYDTPINVTFQRHIFSLGANGRPTSNTDLGGNLRLLRFEIDKVEINSFFGNLHGSWRPLFRFNISPSLSGGITDTKGASQSDVKFGRLNMVVSYIQSFWELLRWSSGVTAGLGANWTEGGTSTRTWDLPLNFSTTWDNLNTRYIYSALTYTYYFIRTGGTNQTTDKTRDHRVQLITNSRYFRNLLFRGDNLFLDFLFNFTVRREGKPDEHTLLTNLQGTYYLPRGFTIKNGFNHFDLSGTPGQVSETVFSEVQWNTLILRSLSVVSSVRQTWQFSEFTEDVETLSGNATLGYQIGLVSLSAQYTVYWNETDTSDTLTQTVYLRAVRPF